MPAPGTRCPNNRPRSGPGALAQSLKYRARLIGTLNLLKQDGLEHSAWPRGLDGFESGSRQGFTSPLVAVDDARLFYIAFHRSPSECWKGKWIVGLHLFFLVYDHSP